MMIAISKSSYFDSLNNLLVSEYLNIKVGENYVFKECINIVNILSSQWICGQELHLK